MLYKRGKTYWYNFRWSLRNAGGTTENFRIVKSARTQNKQDAKDAEEEHRRALRLGEIHPRDPWPKPRPLPRPSSARSQGNSCSTPGRTRSQGRTRFTKAAWKGFWHSLLSQMPRLNAITGDLASKYARHRQEVAENSIVTVNGDLRTLRRILKIAVEWGRITHAPAVHELPQPKGRDRVLSFREEALYLAKASDNLRDATILAVDTGMRPNSELFPLLWADVDLTARTECPNGVIHVRQGKTASAQRSLPLNSACC